MQITSLVMTGLKTLYNIKVKFVILEIFYLVKSDWIIF
jgi:hypothetical protein